jgi:hypothetical protein
MDPDENWTTKYFGQNVSPSISWWYHVLKF